MPPTSIDGTNISGVTIDGTDVQEITVDGDVVFTSGFVDGFEDGNYTSNPSWSVIECPSNVVSSPTHTGSHSLAVDAHSGGGEGGSGMGIETTVAQWNPSDGDTVSTWARPYAVNSDYMMGYTFSEVSDEAYWYAYNGFSINQENNNTDWRFTWGLDPSSNDNQTVSGPTVTQQWYKIEFVLFPSSNEVTGNVYDESGSRIIDFNTQTPGQDITSINYVGLTNQDTGAYFDDVTFGI